MNIKMNNEYHRKIKNKQWITWEKKNKNKKQKQGTTNNLDPIIQLIPPNITA